jgi:hypothetical protein
MSSSIPEENRSKKASDSPLTLKVKEKRSTKKFHTRTKDEESTRGVSEPEKMDRELPAMQPVCRTKPRRRASMSCVNMSKLELGAISGIYGPCLESPYHKSMSDVVQSILEPHAERSRGYVIPSLHGVPMQTSFSSLVPTIPEEPLQNGPNLTPPRPQRKLTKQSIDDNFLAKAKASLSSQRSESPPPMASYMKRYF